MPSVGDVIRAEEGTGGVALPGSDGVQVARLRCHTRSTAQRRVLTELERIPRQSLQPFARHDDHGARGAECVERVQ